MKLHHLSPLFPFIHPISTLSLNRPSLTLSPQIVAQFPNPTPILYTVQNPASSAPQVRLLHDFSAEENHVEGLTGITETSHDVFVFVGGSMTTHTFYAWGVNFTSTARNPSADGNPIIKKIAGLKDVKLPNGLATLPGSPSSVLIADSVGGLTWRLDIQTGKSTPARGFKVGINGIKVQEGYLYFSNSNSRSTYKVRIRQDGTRDLGANVRLVGRLPEEVSFLDDFVVGRGERRTTIFATTSCDNRLWALAQGKRPVVVAGSQGQLTLAGSTEAAFGRGNRDRDVLYVVTSGGVGKPVNGSVTEGGKIVKVDLSAFQM
ncbi:hypothetical protein B0T21DRAFT_388095 [Apiosordaria backusii]|uniref:Uncharacterized protein n=1 Tax=Apiosordaria backusii TaxID=314023 RepID=A0AA39ZS87_9PEZI|nr:hypothetical protein B0T21DRAFT_388095 [Apiosordaria backusii]